MGSGQNLNSSEFYSCPRNIKNKEDPLKITALEWSQQPTHHKSMGFFLDPQGQLTPQFVVRLAKFLLIRVIRVIRDFMAALVTCENKKSSIKNEGTRVVTSLYIDFLDAQ